VGSASCWIYRRHHKARTMAPGCCCMSVSRALKKVLDCLVLPASDGQFCHALRPDDQVRSLTARNGHGSRPVNGVHDVPIFRPRMHPNSRTVRIHKGVDWSAPVGHSDLAAFDVEIVFQARRQLRQSFSDFRDGNVQRRAYAICKIRSQGEVVGAK